MYRVVATIAIPSAGNRLPGSLVCLNRAVCQMALNHFPQLAEIEPEKPSLSRRC
jgi:hypothetical protein